VILPSIKVTTISLYLAVTFSWTMCQVKSRNSWKHYPWTANSLGGPTFSPLAMNDCTSTARMEFSAVGDIHGHDVILSCFQKPCGKNKCETLSCGNVIEAVHQPRARHCSSCIVVWASDARGSIYLRGGPSTHASSSRQLSRSTLSSYCKTINCSRGVSAAVLNNNATQKHA
jgi:hypothetical protein